MENIWGSKRLEAIDKEQIPFDNVEKFIFSEYMEKKIYAWEGMNETSVEDAGKALQVLINFLLLM